MFTSELSQKFKSRANCQINIARSVAKYNRTNFDVWLWLPLSPPQLFACVQCRNVLLFEQIEHFIRIPFIFRTIQNNVLRVQ